MAACFVIFCRVGVGLTVKSNSLTQPIDEEDIVNFQVGLKVFLFESHRSGICLSTP